MARPEVSSAHLGLLEDFGRNAFAKTLGPADRAQMWIATCKQKGLREIPYDVVVKAWKEMVSGGSDHTRLAMSSSVDPAYVSVGVVYDGRLKAAHTLKTSVLAGQSLMKLRDGYADDESFLHAVLNICDRIITKKRST